MIPRRAWIIPILAATIIIATGIRARADQIDCAAVRYYVAEHGKARALAWALQQGYSWREIQQARKCLKDKN